MKIKMIIKKYLKLAYILVISFLFIIITLTTNVYASLQINELIIDEKLDTTNYYHNNRVNPYSSTMYDDEYGFTPGISLVKDDYTEMVFKLNLKDDTSLRNNGIRYYDISIFKDGFDNALVHLNIAVDYENKGVYEIDCLNSNFEMMIYSFGTESTSELDGCQAELFIDNSSLIASDNYYFIGGLFEGDSKDNTSGDNCIYFHVITRSLYDSSYSGYDYIFDKYSINFNYEYYDINDTYELTKSGSITSSYVSVYDCLTSMKDLEVLESEVSINSLDEIKSFYKNAIYKDVIVEYLERIGDTPFATFKKKILNLPVIDDEILASEVAKALNKKSMGVMQSNASSFIYDESSGSYKPNYAKSVWLSAKTVDGNSCNYFLDCNLSYQDYYYQFVEKQIFSQDLYEYMLNNIYTKYPETQSYTASELYGYFGLVSIPNTYSINELWISMFGNETTFDGVIEKFIYTENLAYESYISLLNDYKYNWLEKAWNTVSGFVSGGSYSADTYIFFADCETNQAFIGENGADDIYDDDSAIKNDVDNVVAELGELLNLNSFEDLFKLIIGLIGLYLICKFIIKITVVIFGKKRR